MQSMNGCSYYYALGPIGCDPKSRMEGPSKLKIGRKEAHDMGWPIIPFRYLSKV